MKNFLIKQYKKELKEFGKIFKFVKKRTLRSKKVSASNIHINDNINATLLFKAVNQGNLELVRELIRLGVNLETKNTDGHTALLCAMNKGFTDIVKLLIQNKVNLNAQDRLGNTALSIATDNGNNELVRLLLESGAAIDIKNGSDDTPLLWAACAGNNDALLLFLQYGANINEKNNNGFTALMVAISRGHIKTVDLLLQKGADINTETRMGNTPLILAVLCNQPEIVQQLLEKGASPDTVNKQGYNALHYAQKNNKLLLVNLLLCRANTFQKRLNHYHGEIPSDLVCPVSGQIFNDPITVPTGQTYDRESLIAYFKSKGNPHYILCPLTNKRLSIRVLNFKTSIFVKNAVAAFVEAKEKELNTLTNNTLSRFNLFAEKNTPNLSNETQCAHEARGLVI